MPLQGHAMFMLRELLLNLVAPRRGFFTREEPIKAVLG